MATASCDTDTLELPLDFRWGDTQPTLDRYFVEATIIEVDADGMDRERYSTGLIVWDVGTEFGVPINQVPFGTFRSVIEVREDDDPNARVVFYGLSDTFEFNADTQADGLIQVVIINPPETEDCNELTLIPGVGVDPLIGAAVAVTTTEATERIELSGTPDFIDVAQLTLAEFAAAQEPSSDGEPAAIARCDRPATRWLVPVTSLVGFGLDPTTVDGVSTIYARFRDINLYPSPTVSASLTRDDQPPRVAYAVAEPQRISPNANFVLTIVADEPLQSAAIRVVGLDIELDMLEVSTDRRVYRFARPPALASIELPDVLEFEVFAADDADNALGWAPLEGSLGAVTVEVDGEAPIVTVSVGFDAFDAFDTCNVSDTASSCAPPLDECSIFAPVTQAAALGSVVTTDGSSLELDVNIQGVEPSDTILADFDGAVATVMTIAKLDDSITVSLAPPAQLDPGETTRLTVRAIDAVGNISEAARVRLEWDATPPAIVNALTRSNRVAADGSLLDWRSTANFEVVISVPAGGWVDLAFDVTENLGAPPIVEAIPGNQTTVGEVDGEKGPFDAFLTCVPPGQLHESQLSGVLIARFDKFPPGTIYTPQITLQDQAGNVSVISPAVSFIMEQFEPLE